MKSFLWIISSSQLKDQIRKTSQANAEDVTAELKEWETELARLQALLPIEAAAERLKNIEIPSLEKQKKDQETLISEANAAVEKVNFICRFLCHLTQHDFSG